MAVWINEFHYDNASTDVGEFIEVAGDAGTDLTGYSLVLYNGSDGAVYNTRQLSGVIGDQANGFGVLSFSYPSNGIQNGSPDGLALVSPSGVVIEFISYEGSFTAVGGPANGLISTTVGVSESGSANGTSIARTGTGDDAADFAWTLAGDDSPGAVNIGQSFVGPPVPGAVSVSDVTVDEGAGTAIFTLTRSGGSAAFAVTAATADGSAVAPADYAATSGTVSFAEGQTSATVSVAIAQDAADEADESFTLTLSGATNGATLGDGQAVGTIRDDDATPPPPSTGATDLLISEYVEGSSNNKAIELYNGTGAAISLTGYSLVFYFNGATAAGATINLSGTVAAGDVFVISDNDANATILAQADLASAASFYNGDDTVVLRKNGAVVDSIGQIGTDPGTEWGAGLTSTADNTLRLKAGVITGDTNTADAYDPAVRYQGFATDSVDGLGSHDGGTPPPPPEGPVVTVRAADDAAAEGSAPAFQFAFSRTGDLGQPLTVSFSYGGTASAADFTAADGSAAPTSVTFAAGSATAMLDLRATDDALVEGVEFVELILADGADYDRGEAREATAAITSDDVAVVRVSAVQGAGATSPLVGQTVTVEAVVVGDFQNGDGDASRNLGGFFVQEETADEDGDAATSEGVFVYQGPGTAPLDVKVGDRVRVTATVHEAFGATQLSAPTVTVIGEGAAAEVTAATLNLPAANLEAFEGMLVTVPQTLVISDQFELDRLGEVRLYAPEGDGLTGSVAEAADGRPYQYTQINEPTTDGSVAAYNAAIASRSIIYDDGLNGTYQPITNPDGGGAYTTANAPQMGDSISGLTAVLDFGFSNFRLRSTAEGQNDFVDTNPREQAPADVGGSLKVGSFNVLNFFVTLDDGTRIDNGSEPRGANSDAEFQRQVDKLVTTIIALDADVLGLVELENDFSTGRANALADGNAVSYLVDQLNLALGGHVYSWVAPGTDFVGTDAISVGFIYQNDVVKIADGTTVAVDDAAIHNRPPVAVTFEEIATGAEFTAVANHFKSKGSGSGLNADQGDGQARSNLDRVQQANALLDFLEGNPTGTADPDYVLLGDFNAYYQEDPIDVLRDGGFTVAGDPTSYSYTFGGQLGSLDHFLYSGSLAGQVTGSTKWNINSDEADALDYNLDADDSNAATNRDPAIFYSAEPFRVSDHDPLLLGLNLTPSDKVLTGTAGDDVLTGKNGNDTLSGLEGADLLSGGVGDDLLNGGAGNDTLDGGAGEDDVAVLASSSGDVRVYDLGDGRFRVESAEGTDTITGVERLRFADGSEAAPIELVNDAPVAADSSVATDEDTAADGAATASDPERSALSYSLVSGPANGTLVFNADGTYRYTPNADFNGADSFTFAASDGEYADEGVVSVTIASVNDAPEAGDDMAEVDEDGTVTGTTRANDSDRDGGALAVTGVSGAKGAGAAGTAVAGAYGVLTLRADGGYSYAASDANALKLGEEATDVFTYTLSDGQGGEDTATLSVTIRGQSETYTGTAGDDVLTGTADPETIDGLDGDDALFGQGGDDTLNGGAGFDYLDGGDGADTLDGGEGRDALYGGTGDDRLDGGQGLDILAGGMGDDVLVVNERFDLVIEGKGEGVDRVEASVSHELSSNVEHLLLTGEAAINGRGNQLGNLIAGNDGANRLEGGAGDDVLSGRGGNDQLIGGAGRDVFVFGPDGGKDRVTDFKVGQDTLDLSGFGDEEPAVSRIGKDTVLSFDDGSTLTLEKVDLGRGQGTELDALLAPQPAPYAAEAWLF